MYYDLLVKIKNADRARKKIVKTPYSQMDFSVAKILVDSGYLKSVKKKTVERKSFLEIELTGKPGSYALDGFKILSKPGRRLYISYRNLRSVRQGYGLGILSTPQGIMTNVEARKQKVGGEYLFQIW